LAEKTSLAAGMALQAHFDEFLAKREPPKTFCPSEVARALTVDELSTLGYKEWRDAMADVRQVAWRMRESNQCEILQKGEPIDADVDAENIKGPIRIRRKQ
jgi:hypothetical protein